MLIKMTTAPGQELHSATLAYTGGINMEWVSQLWIAKSSVLGLTLPKILLEDSTKPEICGVVLFCEAVENIKVK